MNPRLTNLLQQPATLAMKALLSEKTEDGLAALARGEGLEARCSHAEAFGAHRLWLNIMADEIQSLDMPSREQLDRIVFYELVMLDSALAGGVA